MKELSTLRKDIDGIDEKIFKLIKERTDISLKIGKLKEKLLVPVKDFAREQECFLKAKILAKSLALPEMELLEIKKKLMEISILGQEEKRVKRKSLSHPHNVAIIGGSGRLGLWLSHYFFDCGHQITIIDKIKPKHDFSYRNNIPHNITDFDIIILATPIRESVKILKTLALLKPKNALIFDVSSIKAPLQKPLSLLKKKGFKITSLHPMFGPSVKILFGQHIIRTSLGVKKADEEAFSLFKNSSLTMWDLGFDEHDRLMSSLLSLPHLVNILFLNVLQDEKYHLDELAKFSSPTFIHQLEIAKKVNMENPHLYYEIQYLNSFNKKLYKNIKNNLAYLIDVIESDKEEKFVKLFNKD